MNKYSPTLKYGAVFAVLLLAVTIYFHEKNSKENHLCKSPNFDINDLFICKINEKDILKTINQELLADSFQNSIVLRIPKFCCDRCVHQTLDSTITHLKKSKIKLVVAAPFETPKEQLIFKERYSIDDHIPIIYLKQNMFSIDRLREPFLFLFNKHELCFYYRCMNNTLPLNQYVMFIDVKKKKMK